MLYDSNGNITDYADRNEKVSTREYDALNRIVKSTAPNGAETEFEYRYDGKLKKVTDALKGTEEFEYNRAGGLTEVKQNGYIQIPLFLSMHLLLFSVTGSICCMTVTAI